MPIPDSKTVSFDRLTFAQCVIDYFSGVLKVKSFEVKRKDSDFFVED